jgi:transcriptional regulator with XRE-family HTH domain
MAVGQRFKELREAKGIEQDGLPSPRPTVSNFENGDGIHLTLLETWCDAMGISPADVFQLDLTRQQEPAGSARPTTGGAGAPASASHQEREVHYQQTLEKLRQLALTIVNVLEGESPDTTRKQGSSTTRTTTKGRRGHRRVG